MRHRTGLATVDVNEFLGLGVFPLNYPLHYLVDLFECTLVLPILMGVLNRMGGAVYGVTIGLIFLGLAFADQNHFKSDDILPRPDLFLFFYAGVAARRRLGSELFHILDTLWETRPRLLLVAAIVFVAGALHTSWLSAPGTAVALTSGFLVMTAVRFSGSLLFAAALPWLRAVAQRGFVVEDGVTFRLLCTHAIVYYLLEPVFGWNRTGIDGIPAFFIAPLIALVAAFVSWRAEVQLKRLFLGLKPARSSGIG